MGNFTFYWPCTPRMTLRSSAIHALLNESLTMNYSKFTSNFDYWGLAPVSNKKCNILLLIKKVYNHN